MSPNSGIPQAAAISINDMLDNCARIRAGQEVLILAYLDGLYGGDNLVDREAISWMQSAIQFRGARASVLWADELAKVHGWRFPPIVKAAMAASDLMINNTLDLSFEEIVDFKQFTWNEKKLFVRNFATTSSLLCTKWAQTPQELVNEIRYQAALLVREGERWQLSDENGTHLEGEILPAYHPNHPWFTSYAVRREEAGYYRPWPEWVHPPINIAKTSGVFVFDRMLSWWSRYIGISPYFDHPISLQIENNRITKIEGRSEAEALRKFLTALKGRMGEGAFDFKALHFGVHPQASVPIHQCPNILYRRIIDHSHSSNIHVHVGAPEPSQEYPYWVHVTGDIRKATFKIGETLIHDRGHLTALDHPAVKAIAAKYPGRPGLE
jgi:hypothetical protein